MPAIAVANNDYVHLAWDFGDTEIPGCIGFAIDRFTPGGASEGTPLQVFAGHDNNGAEKFVSCRERPITKFQWRDVFAKPEEVYWYRVVPMQQGAAKPEPIPSIAAAETGKVTVSEDAGNAKVYFNRGILATQKVAQALWDAKRRTPNRDLIEEAISDPDTPLRKSLAHELFKALTSLLRRAQDGGSCYAALYELTDDALVRELAACKNLHLILSNNNDEDSEKDADGKIKKVVLYDRKNEKAAKTLQGTAKQLIRRYLPQGQIGHNKFMVYCDPAGEARGIGRRIAVLDPRQVEQQQRVPGDIRPFRLPRHESRHQRMARVDLQHRRRRIVHPPGPAECAW